jgi:hypothetical protein
MTTAPLTNLLRPETRAILLGMRRPLPLAAAITLVACAAFVVFLDALPASADELTLKDGTKITGTIVGFEAKSFRVKTSYGFAEVQRDQVVSISIADAAKSPASEHEAKPAATTPAPEPKASTAAAPKPASPDAKSRAVAANSSAAPATSSAGKSIAYAKKVKSSPPAATNANSNARNVEIAAPAAPFHATATVDTPTSSSSTRSASAPVDARNVPAAKASSISAASPTSVTATNDSVAAVKPTPVPEPVREEVSGNLYVNQTYRFQMYKPPSWEMIDGARSILPGAIAAMGTDDAMTYLLVGQEPSAKSLAGAMDATESRLQNVMENYRPLGEERVTVSGSSAIAEHFRGNVDEHDWSGMVVLVPHGSHVYAIFGMTRADNDLVQIEENVIARAISSFEFTASN